MNSDRDKPVEGFCQRAVDPAFQQRDQFLLDAWGKDANLYGEVRALLRHGDAAPSRFPAGLPVSATKMPRVCRAQGVAVISRRDDRGKKSTRIFIHRAPPLKASGPNSPFSFNMTVNKPWLTVTPKIASEPSRVHPAGASYRSKTRSAGRV